MAGLTTNNIKEFGRVVYIEPNNNINGTGRGTNFTFEPEDYSILVELQVDVVDRFSNGSTGTGEMIEYTMEWDAMGTKTSLFKGTNGMLTTRAMDTTFDEIINNYNQESIGINSIEIRYNSWNYPEITIQFTDIRGATLLSSADYAHTSLAGNENKPEFIENYANSFFSTFFRFPYPRYTLIVKGFYGRPVSYTLCVNDFKTRFNSSTGNFDVTVSFIGYMYGLLTDIPMRLLFAAPYSTYKGKKYWEKRKEDGDFHYVDSVGNDQASVQMLTFFELNEILQRINERLENLPHLQEAIENQRKLEAKKAALSEIQAVYESFRDQFTGKTRSSYCDLTTVVDGQVVEGGKYLLIFSESRLYRDCDNGCQVLENTGDPNLDGKYGFKGYYTQNGGNAGYVISSYVPPRICDVCGGDHKIDLAGNELEGVNVEGDLSMKQALFNKITQYNNSLDAAADRIMYINRIDTENNAETPIKGSVLYSTSAGVGDTNSKRLGFMSGVSDTAMAYVDIDKANDFTRVLNYLKGDGEVIANDIGGEAVAVGILNVKEFEKQITTLLGQIEIELETATEIVKKEQEEATEKILGFKLNMKNFVDMCLAHLATLMNGMYECMDAIKGQNRQFSSVGLNPGETDVSSNDLSHLYLPPFFAFKKENPKHDNEMEDAWIGNDPRFQNTNMFQEIEIVEGLLNGMLTAKKEAEAFANDFIGKKTIEEFGGVLGKDYYPTFINDYYLGKNPYSNNVNSLEELVCMFAFRLMEGVVYSFDYPNIGNRFDESDNVKKAYFKDLANNDANNFIHSSGVFDTFRRSTLADAFTNKTWDDFESYITGGKKASFMPTEDGHCYLTGNMDSPLFTKVGNKYVLSYGKKQTSDGGGVDAGECIVPINFKSASEAIEIANNVYSAGAGNTPEFNGIGISRKNAMPLVEVVGNDNRISTDSNAITELFQQTQCFAERNNMSEIGWYFRDAENWAKYFSGPKYASNTDKYEYRYFPTIVQSDAIRSVRSVNSLEENELTRKNLKGNLYTAEGSSGGTTIYAYAPTKSLSSVYKFYEGDESEGGLFGWRKVTGEKARVDTGENHMDKYVKSVVVPEMISNAQGVTLFGLSCAEGSLFESEFYLQQNIQPTASVVNAINSRLGESYTSSDIINFRKAFLFLHSLPTSEYKALGQTLSVLIRKTYTPSIADIPLASALFIGALYWRDKANAAPVNPENAAGNKDIFLVYGLQDGIGGVDEWVQAGSRNLLTYKDFAPGSTFGSKESNNDESGGYIRRPLHPIKKEGKTLKYLTVTDLDIEKKVHEAEVRCSKNEKDAALRRLLEGDKDEAAPYSGFWDVYDSTKQQFIDLFVNWAKSEFPYIDDEMTIKDKTTGKAITPAHVSSYKAIIKDKIFDENGKYTKRQGVTIGKYTINAGETFNGFIQKNFTKNLWNYHARIGASDTDNSLITLFRPSTDPLNRMNKILTNGCTVKVVFPRALMTRDMFNKSWPEERTSLQIGEDVLKLAWETFKTSIVDEIKAKKEEEQREKEAVTNVTTASIDADTKLSLYISLKNLHDKWLLATNRNKYMFSARPEMRRDKYGNRIGIVDNFYFINSFHEYVGDEITINIEELPKKITTVIESQEKAVSLYSFLYDVAQQARMQMLALPVYNDMANPEYVSEMFSPMPFDEINIKEMETETQYVFLYPEEPSKTLKLPNDLRNADDRYKFEDDSFMFVTESGLPNDDGRIPNTFFNDEQSRVPVIGVTFAKQNQSFFKNISVSMDNPKTTEVAINNTFLMANKYDGGNNQITALGQDLFTIYSNYSYECTVEMMGCACIMPLMYFQLNNIPMFKGTYIIYNVAHSITPGNMTTTFSGQRLSRFRTKRNESNIGISPNEDGLAYTSSNFEKSGDSLLEGCYTPSGHKLENEAVYDSISKISGINDKAVLRAVEYAETHYSGGFFEGGKLRLYYDPWMGYKSEPQVTAPSAIVTSQTSTAYTVPNTYESNISMMGVAVNSLPGGDNEENMSVIRRCTTSGAFGIPGSAYASCGAASVDEFIQKSGESFTNQGNYFGTLLKNNTALKDALASKNWKEFAKLYKGAGGVTTHGVYMQGDTADFATYAKDLETGYNEAKAASPQYRPAYVEKSTPFFDPSQETQSYDVQPDTTLCTGGTSCPNGTNSLLDVAAALRHLISHAHSSSISRCATYVKNALQAGGIKYVSCDASDCKGQPFIASYCQKLYDSKPGDYGTRGNKLNGRWEKGDIVIIDSFNKHKYGHIAMWSGTQWISDFKQNNCDIYKDGESAWNAGKFHFYRFKNRKNV